MLVDMALYKVEIYDCVINVFDNKSRVLIDVIELTHRVLSRTSKAGRVSITRLDLYLFAPRLNKNIEQFILYVFFY